MENDKNIKDLFGDTIVPEMRAFKDCNEVLYEMFRTVAFVDKNRDLLDDLEQEYVNVIKETFQSSKELLIEMIQDVKFKKVNKTKRKWPKKAK